MSILKSDIAIVSDFLIVGTYSYDLSQMLFVKKPKIQMKNLLFVQQIMAILVTLTIAQNSISVPMVHPLQNFVQQHFSGIKVCFSIFFSTFLCQKLFWAHMYKMATFLEFLPSKKFETNLKSRYQGSKNLKKMAVLLLQFQKLIYNSAFIFADFLIVGT